jgi:tetratricopeptide (TPR) repeat protein
MLSAKQEVMIHMPAEEYECIEEISGLVGIPSPFPSDPKKIKARIRSYERKLAKEKQLMGCYDDGYGKRNLLGSLYMLLGDLDGALAHFEWYEREFEDCGSEPYHLVAWCLALYKAGRLDNAREMLRQLMNANEYMVPHLLGEEPKRRDGWHGSNYGWLNYALALPKELASLWNEEALDWICQTRDSMD